MVKKFHYNAAAQRRLSTLGCFFLGGGCPLRWPTADRCQTSITFLFDQVVLRFWRVFPCTRQALGRARFLSRNFLLRRRQPSVSPKSKTCLPACLPACETYVHESVLKFRSRVIRLVTHIVLCALTLYYQR